MFRKSDVEWNGTGRGWEMMLSHCQGTGMTSGYVKDNKSKHMDEILERRITRTKVMIQFVRFGDDVHGKRRLEYLDNIGRDKW